MRGYDVKPPTVKASGDTPRMPSDVRIVLAANMAKLMDWHPIYKSQAAVGRKLKKPGQTTIGRMLRGEVWPRLDTLEQLAQLYKLEVWQLLMPDLDPSNPPIKSLSESERALYARLKAVAQEMARYGDPETGQGT